MHFIKSSWSIVCEGVTWHTYGGEHFGHLCALRTAWLGECRATLRINVKLSELKAELHLEGRLVGPWVAELARVWMELLPELGERQLVVDLRDVTYADEDGVEVLRVMYTETGASMKEGSLAARLLKEEVMRCALLRVPEGNHVQH